MEEAGYNTDSNDDIDDRILPDQLIFNEGAVAERKTLYDKLTPEQRLRFEALSRCRLAPLHIRMAMQSALRTSRKPPETAVIVMNSMCKVFVADLVRRSVIVQQDWGQTGPLRPVHIREAIRRSRRQSHDPGSSPAASQRRELFRR
ncbi:TAFII28-like protein domain-containing protein [Plasmodiophora brassicae]